MPGMEVPIRAQRGRARSALFSRVTIISHYASANLVVGQLLQKMTWIDDMTPMQVGSNIS